MSVPKYYIYKRDFYPGGQNEYLRKIGYQSADGGPDEGGPLENEDDFMSRVRAYVMLYAAMLQVDNPRNTSGLSRAWTWGARLLNTLSVNRLTATALDAWLNAAGYRLHAEYKGQFMKVLRIIYEEFIPRLEAKPEQKSAGPTIVRIRTYINERLYLDPDNGRQMPAVDDTEHL